MPSGLLSFMLPDQSEAFIFSSFMRRLSELSVQGGLIGFARDHRF